MSTTTSLLGRKEAADFLDISTRTLDRYVKDGKVNFQKKKGKILFAKEDLAHLNSKTQAHHLHVVSSVDPSPRQDLVQSAPQKYKILWEQAQNEIKEKETMLLEMNRRLGYVEAELKNSVPLLESQNSEQYLQKKLETTEQELKTISRKLHNAKIGKNVLLFLFLFVTTGGFLMFLTQVL